MSAKPRRASHTSRRAHVLAALVVAALIVVVIAAVFRATAENSVAATPRPEPTSILIPSPIPWPVTPQICKDAIQAAENAYDLGMEVDDLTTRSTTLLAEGTKEGSLKKLNEANKLSKEATRLVRAVERARGEFVKKAEVCKRT